MADNFLFYKSWWDIVHECVPEDKRKEYLYEIIRYGITGEMNTEANEMFMRQVKVQINSAKAKHDKRAAAGRKGGLKSKGGGAPVNNQNAKKKTTSKQQANENDNVNDNDNDNDNIILSSPSSCTHFNSCRLGDVDNIKDKWLSDDGFDDE